MGRIIAATLLFGASLASAESTDFSQGWAAYERKDYATAIRYLVMAADEGDPRAARALADINERGLGTPKDTEQAFRWRRLADELGRGSQGAPVTGSDEDRDYWRHRALDAEKREWQAREEARKEQEAARKRTYRAPPSTSMYWGYGGHPGWYDPFWGPGWGYGPRWGHGGPGITFGFGQYYRW